MKNKYKKCKQTAVNFAGNGSRALEFRLLGLRNAGRRFKPFNLKYRQAKNVTKAVKAITDMAMTTLAQVAMPESSREHRDSRKFDKFFPDNFSGL